jgi:lipopolysaccharide transport system ATP-binding protein
MSSSVIKVKNLSKRYRLGLKEEKAETLAGQIANLIKSPWTNLKILRELNRFDSERESIFWALKDVSFEVKEGEVLGIIGKNGAGKSTLLKILSQITEPTSGKIEINGRVASLLEVGTGFHPELSGRENIYMNGTILGMTRREINSKLDEIIDFSGVEKFIDTPVKFYSSGMKVRLGFAVAAHLDPEILIIDEVLAVGDYEFQKKCLGKMEDVSKNQGRTVLFVSHQMDAIRNLCDEVILLDNSELAYYDKTQKVLSIYMGQSTTAINRVFDKLKTGKSIVELDISLDMLNKGFLELSARFESDDIVNYPVLGFVLYNQIGTPIFGSNPRYHTNGYHPKPSKQGRITARCGLRNLHSGIYQISAWFGDKYQDFDHQEKALNFEYVSDLSYVAKPDPLKIGSIDIVTNWTFHDSE